MSIWTFLWQFIFCQFLFLAKITEINCLQKCIDLQYVHLGEQISVSFTRFENHNTDFLEKLIFAQTACNLDFYLLCMLLLLMYVFPYFSSSLSHDSRLRCGVADFYFVLFGRYRPSCLAKQDVRLHLLFA